jgi:hypothetical protein
MMNFSLNARLFRLELLRFCEDYFPTFQFPLGLRGTILYNAEHRKIGKVITAKIKYIQYGCGQSAALGGSQ